LLRGQVRDEQFCLLKSCEQICWTLYAESEIAIKYFAGCRGPKFFRSPRDPWMFGRLLRLKSTQPKRKKNRGELEHTSNGRLAFVRLNLSAKAAERAGLGHVLDGGEVSSHFNCIESCGERLRQLIPCSA
jgi:hypothetical protein